jgi:hypothetical protein
VVTKLQWFVPNFSPPSTRIVHGFSEYLPAGHSCAVEMAAKTRMFNAADRALVRVFVCVEDGRTASKSKRLENTRRCESQADRWQAARYDNIRTPARKRRTSKVKNVVPAVAIHVDSMKVRTLTGQTPGPAVLVTLLGRCTDPANSHKTNISL